MVSRLEPTNGWLTISWLADKLSVNRQVHMCLHQAEEEAQRKAAELVALRAALDAGDKLEPAGAETLLRALLEEAGWSWAAGELHTACDHAVDIYALQGKSM